MTEPDDELAIEAAGCGVAIGVVTIVLVILGAAAIIWNG